MSRRNLELPLDEQVRIGNNYARVVRSPRRRTVEIQVREGEAIVRAPASMPAGLLEQQLQRSDQWLEDKLNAAWARPQARNRLFVDGEIIPYLDNELVLEISSATRSRIRQNGNRLIVQVSGRVKKRERHIRQAITQWLIAEGRAHLEQRADYFATHIGVRWRSLRMKSFRTLWGSCSKDGELAFNWRIMMAPAIVADYVVLHELAHRIEFNHSARFWKIVEDVMPDYREHRDWLHHHSALLNL